MWLQVRTKVYKLQDDGTAKRVSETYVTDAVSISDAEAKITEHLTAYYNEFEIVNISQTSFSEVVFSNDNLADKWYKARLKFILLDESSGKEKYTSVNYLLQSVTTQEAMNGIREFMKGFTDDYTIVSISETNIFDVVVP